MPRRKVSKAAELLAEWAVRERERMQDDRLLENDRHGQTGRDMALQEEEELVVREEQVRPPFQL